jgi:hypothetical protein
VATDEAWERLCQEKERELRKLVAEKAGLQSRGKALKVQEGALATCSGRPTGAVMLRHVVRRRLER